MSMKSPLLIWFAKSPLCDGLTEEEVASLFELFEAKELPRGAVLYREGDASDALYVMLEGHVEVSRGGTELGDVSPGGTVGEMSLLLESATRSATVTAQVPITVLRIGREQFRAGIRERRVPAMLVANLAQQLAERLARANEHVARKAATEIG
jgi:CRP-like cAMP-binding protein